ncbi:hypothetical protein ACFL1X_14530, partial [Candidatus Hydrogenedentota bacterium]
PIADIFFEETIMVAGTTGTEEENHWLPTLANFAARRYRELNGGVHRGAIPGTNDVEFEIVADSDLTEEKRKSCNLILYGTYDTNSVLAKFKGKLPLEFNGKTIKLNGREFTGDNSAVFAVFPHPENPERYIAVHGGSSAPDAIVFGTHIHMGLCPDYLVYNRAEILGWGFWGNEWK